jgi:hypothetical protein
MIEEIPRAVHRSRRSNLKGPALEANLTACVNHVTLDPSHTVAQVAGAERAC